MIYIFDEPSVGLHPRDVHRMNELLQKLRDKGNTVLVVEHDPDVIKVADHVVDIGPHAGSQGGEIVYEGSYASLLKADTLTGKHMKQSMPIKGVSARQRANCRSRMRRSTTCKTSAWTFQRAC